MMNKFSLPHLSLSLSLSLYLSIYLSIYLSLPLFFFLSLSISLYLSLHLSLSLKKLKKPISQTKAPRWPDSKLVKMLRLQQRFFFQLALIRPQNCLFLFVTPCMTCHYADISNHRNSISIYYHILSSNTYSVRLP